MIRKMNKILIAIGSNHEAERRMDEVRVLLQGFFSDIVFSPSMQTKDINMEGPDYINMVAVFHTSLSYQQVNSLLKKLQKDRISNSLLTRYWQISTIHKNTCV